jgi:hypothetical protein
VELKTAIISAAITHLVSVQRTFIEKDLQSLIKELDLLGNFSLMADFLFHPLIPSLLNTLPRDFAENKDLKIAWALSNLYLNQLDPHLIPAFLRAIDSDKKAFKNRSNLKVLLGFLNQFIDNKAQASPRRERGAAIVRHIVTLFKQHADAKRAPAQAKRGGATTTAASQKIDILFDRMAILTIYDQCDLSDSIDLTRDTPALQDALLDRFIPEDLSPAAGAAAAAASSSSSSAPNLRANLKEAIIKSPHPAALLHYLTTLQREGQLVPGKPGFELLQRIAMGDFKERRHTTCSHPAMTPAMRARWEASTSAVQVAGQSLTAVDSEDWEDLLFCGTGIFGSCLNCKESFEQNAGLLGICLDGKIRMATVKNANGVIIARCIMSLTVDQAGKTCLFKESIYPGRYVIPSTDDARQVASALDTLVQHKAAAMGAPLYTYSASAYSGVELSTPPNITGFDYSDVNPGRAEPSFQFFRVQSLYQPS